MGLDNLVTPPAPVLWAIPWQTGRYYTSPLQLVSSAAGSVSAGFMECLPIFVPNLAGVTVSSLNCELTAASVTGGAIARLALYNLDDAGYPTSLIVDGGSFAIDGATGGKALSVSQFLRQGWYGLAWAHSAIASYRTSTTVSAQSVSVIGHQDVVDLNFYGGAVVLALGNALDLLTRGMPPVFPRQATTSGTQFSPNFSGATIAMRVGI